MFDVALSPYKSVYYPQDAFLSLCQYNLLEHWRTGRQSTGYATTPFYVLLKLTTAVTLDYAQYQGQTLQNGVNQWLSVRFAAPPTGKLRFSAPQPPLNESSIQDATKEGALCVSANNVEGLQFGSARQPMAEDCLFMGIYAPANATEDSKLPIMFFIQGGGFTSNSNGNFNGTGLVERSGMNMMVVRINYRVGILGFIAGTAVSNDKNGAVPNNGLNDSKYLILFSSR